jgi:DNA-binding transcriptional ArsR family regulator
VFEALGDPDCRAVLRETSDPRTADELVSTCDIASSTLYRKLELLTRASLIRKYENPGSAGGRVTRYERNFDGVVVRMTANDEFSVGIERSDEDLGSETATPGSENGEDG